MLHSRGYHSLCSSRYYGGRRPSPLPSRLLLYADTSEMRADGSWIVQVLRRSAARADGRRGAGGAHCPSKSNRLEPCRGGTCLGTGRWTAGVTFVISLLHRGSLLGQTRLTGRICADSSLARSSLGQSHRPSIPHTLGHRLRHAIHRPVVHKSSAAGSLGHSSSTHA